MKPKLIIFDVDGVLSTGHKIYNWNGKVVAKQFYDKDFTAIAEFKKAGIHVCWLSADKRINEAIAEKRHIDFWYARQEDGTIDKAAFVPMLCEHYGVEPGDMVYIGDDLHDIPIMKIINAAGGTCWCPSNAMADVFLYARSLGVKGGNGVAVELHNRWHT